MVSNNTAIWRSCRATLRARSGVRGQHLAEPNERSHDSDVDRNSPLAPKYAGEHGNTFLGKRSRGKLRIVVEFEIFHQYGGCAFAERGERAAADVNTFLKAN